MVIKILQFLVSFSLLVLVHEFGHFIFARIFGVRVDRFKIFFGKSLASFKWGETEYAIGWIPFGGYCKLSGMVDESMDTGFLASEPQPYEFRSKPTWQRLLIMAGGVLMNVILAFVIYTGMIYTWGDRYLSTRDAVYGYVFSDEARALGFEDGDHILRVNGKEIEDIARLRMSLILRQENVVEVERGGLIMEIKTPEASVARLMDGNILTPRYPFLVSRVMEGGGAQAAGVRAGDLLVSLNGERMRFFDEYVVALTGLKGRTVALEVQRDSAGIAVTRMFEVNVSAGGKIGAELNTEEVTPVHTREYTLLQSIPAGAKRIGSEIKDYWGQLKLLVNPKTEAYKKISGPIGIGNIFPGQWVWGAFWTITALLSIALAVMNLLPIPGLDGGHILFLLFEMVTGRKPGDKFMMYAQTAGMLIIITLMILITSNDIFNLFKK